MRTVIFYILIPYLFVLASCAAPSEPAALQSSGTENPVAASGTKKREGVDSAADYGGALVGDSATKSLVKTCLSSGKFYERRDNPKPYCTTMTLAEVACNSSKITKIMSAQTAREYNQIIASELSGYLLDQCLDCSTPAGNSYCEGSGATKKNYPGIRLFFVKETNGSFDIKTLYIPK